MGGERWRERKDLRKGVVLLQTPSQCPVLHPCSEGVRREAPGTIRIRAELTGSSAGVAPQAAPLPQQALRSKALATRTATPSFQRVCPA